MPLPSLRRRSSRRDLVATFAGAGLLAALLSACDKAPSAEGFPEWKASDHDGEKAASTAKQGPRGSSSAGSGAGSIVETTWRAQCATCHGAGGKGDGPQAAMFKPADLTSETWQAKVDDAAIAQSIVNGKGRMPKFDLPEDVVRGLVARIRSSRGK